MFDTDKIKSKLKYGFNILYTDETASTNEDLTSLAREGLRSKTVIIANRQTKGKGRGEHTFFSPEGGLYMSLLFGRDDFCDISLVTSYTACAVCEAIRKASGKNAQIKWINDIYIDDKKVCGILTSSEYSQTNGFEWVVIGIGINLINKYGKYPSDIQSTAGFVFDKKSDFEALTADIINNITDYLNGTKNNALEYYRNHCYTLKKNVTVLSANGDYEAFAKEITDDFSLKCQKPDNSTVILNSGEVSVKIK